MRKILCFICLLLTSNIFYAQVNKSENSNNNKNSQSSNRYELKLFNNNIDTHYSHRELDIHFNDFDYLKIKYGFENNGSSKFINMKRVTNDMRTSLMIMRRIQLQNKPTVLEQVLQMANTAAAFGLAGYHIYKYGLR